MADTSAIHDEIQANALRPQSTVVDGESIAERSIQDQIAAAKFLGSQNALNEIGNGKWPLATMTIRPPGGRQ